MVVLNPPSIDQHEELQIILEDIRNQLTVLKGIIQIASDKKLDNLQENLLFSSIGNANDLIGEALVLLNLIKC